MKKIRFFALLLVSLIMLSGCANVKLVADYKTDSIEPHRYKKPMYFWGLKARPDILARCDSKCICQVQTTVSAKQVLVTVLTLGIVIPTNIQWECCPPPLKENKVE